MAEISVGTTISNALNKNRATRNRTLVLTESEAEKYTNKLLKLEDIDSSQTLSTQSLPVGTINADFRDVVKKLPKKSVDLLFLDPPYNLTKDFHGNKFSQKSTDEYTEWLENIIINLKPLLKNNSTIYICGDWLSSVSIFAAASKHFIVRNRITWEREKGKGAKTNWKNSTEDIWFCTLSNEYTFNVDSVKLRRKVLAPYRLSDGSAKDWQELEDGNFRDTYPSNIWTDITIPFWSMPENTDHPTQKSEKLLAKLILASSNLDDYILDPFLGSGTCSVVAKKLGRKYLGIDTNKSYCLLAEKRLDLADLSQKIQGFEQGIFWERNTSSKR